MNVITNFKILHDEDELVRGLKNADDHSFEFIVREYGGYLMTIARRYLPSEADVQDCVQETFLQVVRNVNNFEGRSSLKSWLHRIVVNAALAKIRTQGRRLDSLADDTDAMFDVKGSRIVSPSEAGQSVELTLIGEETNAYVRKKIQELPKLSRNLLMLRDIEGYSTQETTMLLDMSTAAVKTGLHRARRALKTAVSSQTNFSEVQL